MRIKLAKRIGFCFGVKRAVNMAEEALEKDRPIYSLGSIIHNRQVVEDLFCKGLKVIKDINGIKGGVVVISSHGISPKIAKRISGKGIKIIDTTCPFVLKAQEVARRLSNNGYKIVIVGDANHPEIKALVDFVPNEVSVVKDPREASRLELGLSDRVSVISQTTQSTDNFLEVVKAVFSRKPKEICVFNTICHDAESRQKHAGRLAKEVDLMLVVGGKDSANTKRLYEVCKKILKRSYLVESENELRDSWFKKGSTIGITSGASTPDWIIKRVIQKIKQKGVA